MDGFTGFKNPAEEELATTVLVLEAFHVVRLAWL